jgi:hypothetical protein
MKFIRLLFNSACEWTEVASMFGLWLLFALIALALSFGFYFLLFKLFWAAYPG